MTTAELARSALRGLASLSTGTPRTVTLCSEDHGREVCVTIPAEALRLLVEVLAHMAEGKPVCVLPRGMSDVLEEQGREDAEARASLDALAAEAQRLDLGY